MDDADVWTSEWRKDMEKEHCELGGRIFINGSTACMGDQCLRCSDGKWKPDDFEFAVSSTQD
jgi:hypothetical protein